MRATRRARAAGGSALPVSAVLFFLCWASRPEAPAYGLYLVGRRFLAGAYAVDPARNDMLRPDCPADAEVGG